jgi:hypothetical protein
MMKLLYSPQDVVRWEAAKGGSVALHLQKLSEPGLVSEKQDFHLGMLSLSYQTKGMIFIAQGRYEEAVHSFHDSIKTLCKMYERFEKEQGGSLEAGHFQSVLVAFVTKDEPLVSRLVGLYRADEGTPDSIFLGKALKLVASGDIDGAKTALAQRKPRFEPQFVGYADCLQAIANKDQQRFVSALNVASESWAKWASKRVKGLPDSVCFIQGVGLIRLAERVVGNPIPITNEYMPQELLR